MSRFPGGKSIFLLYLCLCLFVALASIGPGRLSAQATDTNPDTWPVASVGSRIGPIGGEMRSVHGGWLGLVADDDRRVPSAPSSPRGPG